MVLVDHFLKNDIFRIELKYSEQLNSLIIAKEAFIFNNELKTSKIINLTNLSLSKSQIETLSYGFNMTWPAKMDKLGLKVEIEFLLKKLKI